MRGYLLVLAAAALWGLIGVQSRYLLDTGMDPLEIAFWRALIAGGMFAVVAVSRRGAHRLPARRDLPGIVGFALVGVTLFYAAYALAVDTGGVSLAAVLLYTAPVIVVVGAHLLLDEPLTGSKIALVLVSITGVVLVAAGGGTGISVSVAAVGWGLAASLGYSSYYLYGKRALARIEPAVLYGAALPLGGLALLPLVEFTSKGAGEWALLLSLSVFSTFLAYGLYAAGLRLVQASRAVIVATVEPVVAAAAGAALFAERLAPLALVGTALVIAAAAATGLTGRSGRGRAGSRRAVSRP